MKKLLSIGAFLLAIIFVTSCGNTSTTNDSNYNQLASLNRTDLDNELNGVAQHGFLKSWEVSPDNLTLTCFMVDDDWKSLDEQQRKQLTRRLLDTFGAMFKKHSVSELWIKIKTSNGNVLLAEDSATGSAKGESPKIY